MRAMWQVVGFACMWALVCAGRVAALETDQFTPPPAPLVDLGPGFEQEVTQAIVEAIETVNQRRQEHLRNAAKAPFKFLRDEHLKKAEACLAAPALAKAVYQATVYSGHPQCKMEMWARYTEFEQQPARFSPPLDKTVMGAFSRPITIWYMSPTINLHGVYLGTDKIGHFFEQGYEYYEVYQKATKAGRDEATAIRKAIQKGVGQEKGIYGLLVDSVFSNADLAANYAGLKFYLNLTRPIMVAGQMRPAMVVLKGDRWELNPAATGDVMRPFISEHWNEGFNPSKFGWPLRNAVRNNVRTRLDRFLAFYNTTVEQERRRLEQIRTWYGEEYGHSGWEQLVTVVSVTETPAKK